MGELIDVATAPRRGDTAVTTAARRAPTWAWLRARLPWWVAVAAAFTTVFVLLSVRVGRLQSPLHGDDMMYFLDGLDRLDQFRSKGLSGVVAGYVDRPPHSPWASFLAAGCFGLFGMREWAPFVGNGLLIMALVGFVDFLAIGRGPWSRRFCLFMACTAPFAAQAVMQFRPDFAAGLLTAIGVVLVLRSNFAESSRRHQAAAGVAFGLALLVKPTGSPFTLAMTGGTLVLATLCDWLTRPGLTVRQVASSWAWCVGPLLALAGPHYALAWRSVAKIVALNTTDPQAKVWTMSGGEVFPWYYYLTGLGGRMMLRNHLYLFGAICLASFVFVVRARDREAIVRHVAFGLVLLVAWAIPTMLGSFSPFFTQTFVVLLLFCAVLAVGDVMPRVSIGGPRSPWITRVAVAGAVVLPFVGMASRTSGVAPDPARIRLHHEIYRDVLQQVRARSGDGPARVFLTCNGEIAPETLTWLARKDGVKAAFRAEEISTDLDVFRSEIDRSTLVLAVTTHGNGKVHPWLPSAEVADTVLALLRARPDFRQVATFGPLDANEYYLFARVQ
jgi:hypothetical protein